MLTYHKETREIHQSLDAGVRHVSLKFTVNKDIAIYHAQVLAMSFLWEKCQHLSIYHGYSVPIRTGVSNVCVMSSLFRVNTAK